MVQLGGASCSNYPYLAGDNRTIIMTTNTITVNGTITSFCVYTGGNVTVYLRVFRDDGTNYNYVGGSGALSCSAGANTQTGLSIAVQAGDLVGLYIVTTSDGYPLADNYLPPSPMKYKTGDVTSNSAKSTWSSSTYGIMSLTVSGNETCSTYEDVYVNSSTGSDSNCGATSGSPVQTFGKAYTDRLNAGGTIHVLNSGADFSGETVVLNKSFSITVDGGGYYYGPKAA